MAEYITECEVEFLTLGRASKLVPPEFMVIYNYYMQPENEFLPGLPMREFKPKGIPFPVVNQSGIYAPNYDRYESGGVDTKYAVVVHSQGNNYYDDKEVLEREDGTWLFDYSGHRGQDGSTNSNYNQAMLNNLRDGVPVVVLIKQKRGGYHNLGLAFVEQYNSLTNMFTLHGPINAQTEAQGFFSYHNLDSASQEQAELFENWSLEDERKQVQLKAYRRERQEEFRRMIVEAYDGTCALTGVNILQVLEAAHIDPYRGRKSQIVNNGLLLRADFHLLYDAHLITIEPDTKKLHLSDRLRTSGYGRFDRATLSLPTDTKAQPNEGLLDMHYQQFHAMEKST